MVVVTDRVIHQVIDILDRFHSHLMQDHSFNCRSFETEIAVCLDINFHDLKRLVVDLSQTPPYIHVAAYYMEHCGFADEFQIPLAAAYRIGLHNKPDQGVMRMRFWDSFFSNTGGDCNRPGAN